MHAERAVRLPVDRRIAWTWVADYARFARFVGAPELRFLPPSDAGAVARFPSIVVPTGARIDHEPLEWIPGHWYGARRYFDAGPWVETVLGVGFLDAAPGCEVRISIDAVVRDARAAPSIDAFLDQIERALYGLVERAAEGEDPLDVAPSIDAALRERATAASRGLGRTHSEARVVDALLDTIAGAPALELRRMRPIPWARARGFDPAVVLDTWVRAAHAGLLVLAFEVLCPSCRQPGPRRFELAEIRGEDACPACAVRFAPELDRHVEVTFRPADALRPGLEATNCLAGPDAHPHVFAQVAVEAHGRRLVDLDLAEGEWRVRLLRQGAHAILRASAAGPGAASVTLPGGPAITAVSARCSLTIESADAERRVAVVEREAWSPDLVTAAELSTLQVFHDLYPRSAVAAGSRVAVGRIAFLFTDLEGSTAMYARMGDGDAYSAVHRHFAVLESAIASHRGTLVKTIGDAVMAAFQKPENAVACGLAMLDAIREVPPLALKVGVHAGPCLAVRANDSLDYFGTTVNTAARIQGQARGGEMVLAAELAGDEWVGDVIAGLSREPFMARLAGLPGDRPLVRVRRP